MMMGMHHGFWGKLKKPFMIMAPLADVTDAVFRLLIAEQYPPDVMYTEFVSADGLCHPKGREKLLIDLKYSELERPIVAQLFTGKPEKMREAAALCAELGFDGIDINMGCPDRKVEKQGASAALIKDPTRAQAIIRAAQEGAGGLPVSVKTRIGYSSVNEFENWIGAVLETEPAVVTLHLRTRDEMSKVPAHWEFARKLVELRGNRKILLAGNGDVVDLTDARTKAAESGLDGIMLGRAIFGNPWLFAGKHREDIPYPQRMRVMLEHTKRFEEAYVSTKTKNFAIMRKFYGEYIAGHPHAKQFREELMECEDYAQVAEVVRKFTLPA